MENHRKASILFLGVVLTLFLASIVGAQEDPRGTLNEYDPNLETEKPADAQVKDSGFTFPKNEFALNENFLVSKDGLLFFFNSYEIAPYALGPTQILLPWRYIKTLVKLKGPVDSFLAD
ncbi:DUF3298 domain-containing protein [bacterium]|nr:DUF3298 domain-containing protein [bacterium]